MARRRKGKKRKAAKVTVAGVLAGHQVPADARQMLGLINEVNPTGREFDADETSRRYADKNALITMLVQRHGEDLEVEPGEKDPGVVSIRRQKEPDDACHAKVATLDEETQSWIRLQLDMGEWERLQREGKAVEETDVDGVVAWSESIPDAEPRTPAELRRAAEDALEQWDYDTARSLLERAVLVSGGGGVETQALLRLLVDDLADYDAAVALHGRLPERVAERPKVRILLALAHARSAASDPEALTDGRATAERMVRGLTDERLAEVWVALARNALRGGDADEAARYVDNAAAADPGRSGLPGLRREIETQQRDRVPHLEQQLDAAREAGDQDAMDRAARQLLEIVADHEGAREELAQVEEARAGQHVRRILEEAMEAFEGGELEHAARLWEKALTLGASTAVVGPALRRCREQLQLQQAERAEHEVDRGLASGVEGAELVEVLIKYASLDGEQRSRLRDHHDHPELAWLDQLGPPQSAVKIPAMAAAVVALGQAMAAARSGDHGRVEQLLSPHLGELEPLGLAQEMVQAARDGRARVQQDAWAEAVSEAETAVDDRRWEDAEVAIQVLTTRASTMEQQRKTDVLRAEMRRRREMERAEADYEAAMAAEDLDRTYEALHTLVKLAKGDETDRWLAEGKRCNQMVAERWYWRRVEGVTSDPPVDRLTAFDLVDPFSCVIDDGPELRWIHAWSGGEQVFLTVRGGDGRDRTAQGSDAIESRITFRPPESLGPMTTSVTGEHVWMVTGRGIILVLDGIGFSKHLRAA